MLKSSGGRGLHSACCQFSNVFMQESHNSFFFLLFQIVPFFSFFGFSFCTFLKSFTIEVFQLDLYKDSLFFHCQNRRFPLSESEVFQFALSSIESRNILTFCLMISSKIALKCGKNKHQWCSMSFTNSSILAYCHLFCYLCKECRKEFERKTPVQYSM